MFRDSIVVLLGKESTNLFEKFLTISVIKSPVRWVNTLTIKYLSYWTSREDVFSTEDYEDCTDKNNEIETSSSEIEVEVEDITDSQNLLNSNSDSLNEPVKDCSDMTLKQGVSEPELFAAEDILVNPDDLLPPVVKLEKYANSDIVFNRQVVVRNLLETLRIVHENKDDVASVINVITGISEDYDPSVRTELMMHLPHLAAFCNEVKLNYITIQYLVPMLISYLGDDNNLIRKAAQSALLSLIEQGLLEKDLVVEKICPLVLHLTDSIHQEDLRIESIVLMSKLVTQMGKKVTEELFFEPLFNLLQETSNYIRKACASTFGDVCTAVGRETTEEVLLPKFFALCEDDAWCVRKACAENFMTVSCCVSKDTRRKELCSLYMILLSDTSRWVRMTAYQALGAFISTFAEPDRTGLYYSKDGTLTVVEDAPSPEVLPASHEPSVDPTNETICDGELKETNNLSSDDCSSSLDRTNSSKPCDSVVPVCNANTNNSASDVPGNTCHVGNYCTVILNSSTMTSSERDQSQENVLCNDSSTGSSHCDSKQLTENLQSGDNFASAHGEVVQNGEFLNHSEEGTSAGNTEDELNQSLTEEEKEFKKLWIEAVYSCNELVNGASNSDEINGGDGMCVDLDSDVVQYMKPDEKSALLNSIIVNGVNINSSVALSGTVNCGAIPFISCSNSIRENGTSSSPENSEDSEVLSIDIKHSTHNTMCTEDSDVVPSLTFSTQELNNAPKDISLEDDSEEELKVNSESTDNESAFNHFQYWREPLPEIDIDTATDCLNESPKQSGVYFMCESEDHFDGQQERGNWFSYLKECSNKRTFITYSGLAANSSLLMQLNAVNDDEASENKGEPPPGPKLTPHDQDIVPPELLFQYLSMIDPSSTSSTDAEMARHCAYSLPAVALTLGRKNWPCLKETFNALTSDLQGFIMMWKVRRTIASGMHQLAVILGPDITSQDLLPVFFRFITDLDEVRIGILQNLCEFLKVLRSEERKQFLPSLPEFLVCFGDSDTNLKNWRFRLILAEQLVLISNLYEPQEVRDHLVPLSLTLIKDKICEVRLAAVRVVAAVMKRLSQNPTPVYTKAMLSELTEKFVHSPKWLHRQLYVYVCQQIILEKALSPDQFAEDALPQLLYLCWDRVPNVRIAIARCLVVGIWPMDVYSNPESPHRELLLQTIHTLQSDMDADVRFYANMVSTHECSCLQNGEFTNVVEPFV